MRARFAVLVVAAAACLAGAATANPKNYNYSHCTRRFGFGLETRHRQLHREAVERDERNHVENRSHEKRLRERHDRLKSRLAADHNLLSQREAEFRRARSPRPVVRPAERPPVAPPPAPVVRPVPRDRHLDRGRGHKENPGLHLGHEKGDNHPGKTRGHDDDQPGKAKGHGDDNPGKGKGKKR